MNTVEAAERSSMTDSSFNDTLDRALRGKYVRVHTETGVFEGWVDRVHGNRGSVVLHDATNTTTDESLGSVFIRVCEAVEVLKPRKRIEFVPLEELSPYPEYDIDFTPEDGIIRRCYRNQFPGSFPVVRENGTILDGHKRVAAAEIAGLERLPVEVIAVTDQQAADLFRVAHRDDAETADAPAESDEATADVTNDTERETEDTEAIDDTEDTENTGGTEDERNGDSGVVFGYDV